MFHRVFFEVIFLYSYKFISYWNISGIYGERFRHRFIFKILFFQFDMNDVLL